MGENINKQFDEFQEELEKREKRIKYPTSFKPDDNIDKVLEQLKDKEVVL